MPIADPGAKTSGQVFRKPPTTFRRAVILLAALLAMLGTMECALRFGLGLGNPVLIVADPACMYTLKPDQDIFRFFAHTHVNHLGMRSDEVPSRRTPGTLRILFVGDSIAYGTSRVDQRQLFTEILHRELPSIVHRPVEVLNASAGGWAIDNEYSYVRSRGAFQSDLVLLVLNSGDLPQRRSTMAEVGSELWQRRPSTAVEELYLRYIKPRLFHTTIAVDAGDVADKSAASTIRDNLAELDSFKALVASQGSRLVIVYVPFRMEVPDGSAYWLSLLQAWTASRHVPLLDLTPAEAPYSAEEITLDHGVHLNARGHLAVAREMEKQWPIAIGRE